MSDIISLRPRSDSFTNRSVINGSLRNMNIVSSPDPLHSDELNSITSSNNQLLIEWTPEHETILVEWADKALCYKWLHEKSHGIYSKKNTWLTIPVIIMSTLTGTANFAQARVPADYVGAFTMAVGSVNLFAGILTTIQQYLKISELNEAHRVSAISWGKFYRNVKVELAKSPIERTPVVQMIKIAKEEFDRLIETSPNIEPKIIQQFKETFYEKQTDRTTKYDDEGNVILSKKQELFEKIKKPEECDILESTADYVYKPKPAPPKPTTVYVQVPAPVQPAPIPTPPPAPENNHKNNEIKKKKQVIAEFIDQFQHSKKRAPTSDEIITNLEGTISVDIIESILSDLSISKEHDYKYEHDEDDSIV